jgi:hypothetical protein
VVNAIANVGAIIESEKPKASIAPTDLRRSANVSLRLIKAVMRSGGRWIAQPPKQRLPRGFALADYPSKPVVSYLD